MPIHLEEARDDRIARIRELMALTDTTLIDYQALGFTAGQVKGWFSPADSTKERSPSSLQLVKIWRAFDWSPTYIVFGKGAKLLSQVSLHEDMAERMDRFENVLQLALNEAAANKKRYRGALKTIEERNEQVANNRNTLVRFGEKMELLTENMAALSDQLAKVNRS